MSKKIGVLAQEDYIRNGLQTFERNLVPWLLEHEEFEPIYYSVENGYPGSRTLQTLKLRSKLREKASSFDKVFIPAQNRLRFDPESIDAEVVPYVHDVIPHTAKYKKGRDRFLRPFFDAAKKKLDAEYLPHLTECGTVICASEATEADLHYRTGFQGSSEVVYQGVDARPVDRFSHLDREIDALYVGELFDRKNPEMVRKTLQKLDKKGFSVASVNFDSHDLPGKTFEDVSDERLAEIYSGSRFILHFSKMEGFGRTPVEAQRYGCVPLGLDNRVNREILGEPGYGWVDVDSVSEAVSIVGKGVRPEIRDNARQNSSRFTWDRTRKQLRDILLDQETVKQVEKEVKAFE